MKYAISDIHGDEARFRDILRQINLQADDTLYILGDVVDRGKDGIKLLLEIMEMRNARMTLGNHELMMLMSLDDAVDKWDRHDNRRLWYRNGGEVTHKDFVNLPYDTQRKVLSFIKKLPLCFSTIAGWKRYFLTHSAPPKLYFSSPHAYQYFDINEFAVWERINDSTQLPKGYTYVHGHTPTNHEILFCEEMRIYYGKNKRINIDCGCGYPCGYYDITGYLACLRLDDLKEFYSFPKND